MTITELSIKRPPLIIVIFTVLGVLGFFSYNQLKYELIPDVTPPYVTVTTVYPGGSPNEVETSITKVVEDAVASVDKIKRVFSNSAEGVSFVFVEFSQTADADVALQNVQRKVGEVVNNLPEGAKAPIMTKFSLTELPVLRMAATSDMPSREFYQFMKDKIKPQLTKLAGVGQLTFIGSDEREIKINLNLEKLQSYGISALQVLQLIKSSNFDFPVGKVKDSDGQYIVRISGKFDSLEGLKNLVVSKSKSGGNIKLQDVAEIEDGQKEKSAYARFNGRTSLGIFIQKQSDANSVEVSRLVRAELKKLEETHKDKNLRFAIAQDGSQFTLEAAEAVNSDLTLAIILVAVVMLLFLHSLRSSVIVMIAIPASLVSTFIGMWLLGYTLNIMSLLALSLVIGILVDDSIVVLENIYRHMEMGKPRKTAALDGRNEIGFSALSITLVDVVVFLPLALIQGLIGNIVRQFAMVVVVSTLLSLFVSFTITPMLASRFSKIQHLTKNTIFGRFGIWFESMFDRLTEKYTSILKSSLRHGWLVIGLAGILLFLSIALIPAGFIGSEFMTPADRGELSVILEFPERMNLEETNQYTLQAERLLARMPEVKNLFVYTGASSEGFIGYSSNNIAEVNVSLVDKNKRAKSDIQMSREIKKVLSAIPGAKVRVSPIGIFGSGDMAPIAVVATGTDYNEVKKAAAVIESVVKTIPGTADVRLSSGRGKPEAKVDIDREKMASLGLSLDQVAATLRIALTGDDDSKFREGSDEYNIRIVFDEDNRNRTAELGKIIFTNYMGEKIQLQQFADIYETTGPSQLSRRNRLSSVTVFSQAVGRPSGDIGEDIKKALAKVQLPSGIDVSYEGDLENQEDSFSSLGIALMVGILFVYLIMVALYNSFIYPFIVLFSIPVAIVGALLALALMMKSLNIFSILGIIMLVGLVGKNAILLVDRTNQMRLQGLDINSALIEAAQTRIRPILMTTLAMVFGMLPIALSLGASSELKSGLATAIIGGLISSLVLTLVLVPAVYVKVENLRSRVMNFISRHKKSGEEKKDESFEEKEEAEESYSGGSTVGKMTLLLVFALSLYGTAGAQTKKLSLNDAVSIALEQNRDIKVAYLEKARTDEKVKEARGNAFPEVTASGQFLRNLKLPVFYMPGFGFDKTGQLVLGPSSPMEIGLKNNFSGAITFQMPLYQGAVYAGIRAASVVNAISEENIINTRAAAVTDVKKAYFNVLIVKEQYNLLSQSIKRGNQAVKDVRLLYNQGLASDLDTLRAFVAVENLKPMLIKAESGIVNAQAYLVTLLGLKEGTAIELTDSLSGFPVFAGYDITNAGEEAMAKRPELSLLDLQIRANDEVINYEFSSHMPSLAAFGQYKFELQSDNFQVSKYTWPSSSFVGLQLSVPVFSGFKTEARVEQARLEGKKLHVQLENAREMIKTEVKVAASNLAESQKRIESQKRTVQAAERSYELTRSRWLKGLSRQNELFDADLALSQAKTSYLQAIHDYLTAQVELDKALGRTGRM